jgi:hypothetical protein
MSNSCISSFFFFEALLSGTWWVSITIVVVTGVVVVVVGQKENRERNGRWKYNEPTVPAKAMNIEVNKKKKEREPFFSQLKH